MLKLHGLTPNGVRSVDERALLRWSIDGKDVETTFDRFRPVGVKRDKVSRAIEILWGDLGDSPLTDSFYKVSIDHAAGSAYASARFRTDTDILKLVANEPDLLPFSGVVFHMARTGSTLIHRLFSKIGRVQSLSEISLLDKAMSVTERWPDEDRNAVLHDLLAAFRRPRRPNEHHFITKMTDAGASIRLPLFRQAFPDVPWIFVYREPIEVMVSVLSKPSGNIDGWYRNRSQAAARLQMPQLADPGMWPEEFMARTLRRFCRTAVVAAKATPKGKFLAVPYSRLPDAIWESIAPHFGIALTDQDRDVMRAEARFSAKATGSVEFKSDSEAKRAQATPYMIRLANELVGPAIEELRSLPQA